MRKFYELPWKSAPGGNLAKKNSLYRKEPFLQALSRQGLYKIFSVLDPIYRIKSMVSYRNGVYAGFSVSQTPFFLKSGAFCMIKHA